MVLGPIKRETTHNKAASVASEQDMENFRKLCRNNIEEKLMDWTELPGC